MKATELVWRTSSHSMGNGGNCVEVADGTRDVHVRDSKQPDRAALSFGRRPWQEFINDMCAQGS